MITTALLTNAYTNALQSSFSTASITPTANKVVIIAVFNEGYTIDAGVPSISGCNITWNQITTRMQNSGNNYWRSRVTLFWGVSDTPTVGALTINCGANSSNTAWAVVQLTGAATVTPIVQSNTNSFNGSATGLSLTLSSFANPLNATLGICFAEGVSMNNSGSNFTNLSLLYNNKVNTQFANSPQTNVNWTWSSTNDRSVAAAIEIKNQPPAGNRAYIIG
ncbi:MAG TPA: hypothetical protein VH186_06200 [Chloroflexia bacterium]|nr:hypothetical protein [Chloroflexia bacterium]